MGNSQTSSRCSPPTPSLAASPLASPGSGSSPRFSSPSLSSRVASMSHPEQPAMSPTHSSSSKSSSSSSSPSPSEMKSVLSESDASHRHHRHRHSQPNNSVSPIRSSRSTSSFTARPASFHALSPDDEIRARLRSKFASSSSSDSYSRHSTCANCGVMCEPQVIDADSRVYCRGECYFSYSIRQAEFLDRLRHDDETGWAFDMESIDVTKHNIHDLIRQHDELRAQKADVYYEDRILRYRRALAKSSMASHRIARPSPSSSPAPVGAKSADSAGLNVEDIAMNVPVDIPVKFSSPIPIPRPSASYVPY